MIACILVPAVGVSACGDDPPADRTPPTDPPAETAPPTESADTTAAEGGDDVTLLAEVPNGSPMPDASRTGIPPYPDAIVHTRFPRDRPGISSFEAFTPDSWAVVEAYYDSTLGSRWVKTPAKETTIYEKGDDEAAITLTPWNPDDLPPNIDHPPVLRNARTIIGVAWRPDAR